MLSKLGTVRECVNTAFKNYPNIFALFYSLYLGNPIKILLINSCRRLKSQYTVAVYSFFD